MIIVLKQGASSANINELLDIIQIGYGAQSKLIKKGNKRYILILGIDSKKIRKSLLMRVGCVDYVHESDELFNFVERRFDNQKTIVKVGDMEVGSGDFCIIGGPCSVESEEQMFCIADRIKRSGAKFLRGGAFKPRTSPYSFQGLGERGIELLLKAKRMTGLGVITELVDLKYLDLFCDVDIIQVGARNMQNFEMLKQLGRCKKPILLKRGIASTIHEWLMSAEYILSGGNTNVMLCERGIRTYETFTRNTLDISAVAVVKKISHLPVFVDPSHASGLKWLVEPLSKAAVSVGADGIMVEVHDRPSEALCDGNQALNLDEFDSFMKNIEPLVNIVCR